MSIDGGDAQILRVEMEEGNGNCKGMLVDKVVEEIVLYPLLMMKHDMLFLICWIVRKGLENQVLQL